MMRSAWIRGMMCVALVVALGLSVGCNREQPKPSVTDAPKKTEQPKDTSVAKDTAKTTEKQPHDHSGWWCNEHGVPEEECSMCLPEKEVKSRFKDKGDWCKEHDRAKSQCFVCDPKLREKFAAKYRAKYGKEPPPPEDNMPKEEPKKPEPMK